MNLSAYLLIINRTRLMTSAHILFHTLFTSLLLTSRIRIHPAHSHAPKNAHHFPRHEQKWLNYPQVFEIFNWHARLFEVAERHVTTVSCLPRRCKMKIIRYQPVERKETNEQKMKQVASFLHYVSGGVGGRGWNSDVRGTLGAGIRPFEVRTK